VTSGRLELIAGARGSAASAGARIQESNILFKLILSFILLPLASLAGDLSGAWSATLNANGKVTPLRLEFRQQGTETVGALGMRADFMSTLREVRLVGSALTFEVQNLIGATSPFEGVVDGDRASGQLSSIPPGRSGKLEMKRTGPPARMPALLAAKSDRDDLAALSDEFDKPGALRNWKSFAAAEGWPDRIEKADVNATSPGHLHVVPQSGAWWAGYHGVYFFKEVTGDFVITTRVKVTGKGGGEPTKIWTISGLLLRAPADAKVDREQRKENWIYVMTGRGPGEGRVIDAKSTLDGINAWDITPTQPGWYELRIARVGPLFIAMCRPDGGDWMLRKRIARNDLPETLQAGINVTSDFKLSSSMPSAKYNAELFPGTSSVDSATTFDYVRFGRLAATQARKTLAGREFLSIDDTDLLALLR
jgi:hypothetical protein